MGEKRYFAPLDYRKLFKYGQKVLKTLSKSRVNDIDSVLKAVLRSAEDGCWGLTLLVYDADSFITEASDLIRKAHSFAERDYEQPSRWGSKAGIPREVEADLWVAWLIKGILRYVFMTSGAGDAKWRYLLGSSRKPAFASRAGFRVAARDEVEKVVGALKALGAEEKALEQQTASSKYLLVNVVDCKVEGGKCASEILDAALQKLGLKLVRMLTLKGCKP